VYRKVATQFAGWLYLIFYNMVILSDTSVLQEQLGSYTKSDVFIAEKIIINYINKDIAKEDWDEWLSIATCEIVKRMQLDKGIKSESDDNHSITYRDIKSIQDILGASIVALLDWYKDSPTTTGMNWSFSMI